MNLVRVGKIGRPHSFRGAFVVQEHSGPDSVLGSAKRLWVGTTAENAKEYPVAEARWVGQGWVLKLAGVDSDEWVKASVHQSVFQERAAFPEADGGEYYVADLIGFTAVDAESGERLGNFLGAETPAPGMGPDRWWFQMGGREVAVPAIPDFVVSVDLETKTIVVRGLKEMP